MNIRQEATHTWAFPEDASGALSASVGLLDASSIAFGQTDFLSGSLVVDIATPTVVSESLWDTGTLDISVVTNIDSFGDVIDAISRSREMVISPSILELLDEVVSQRELGEVPDLQSWAERLADDVADADD